MARSLTSEARIELAKKCLRLIGRIAERCARSQNPAIIGYAIQELSQVLLERTGAQNRGFEPVDAEHAQNILTLHAELDWVDGSLSDLISRETPVRFEALPVGEERRS